MQKIYPSLTSLSSHKSGTYLKCFTKICGKRINELTKQLKFTNQAH
jgi:hypothetical protein